MLSATLCCWLCFALNVAWLWWVVNGDDDGLSCSQRLCFEQSWVTNYCNYELTYRNTRSLNLRHINSMLNLITITIKHLDSLECDVAILSHPVIHPTSIYCSKWRHTCFGNILHAIMCWLLKPIDPKWGQTCAIFKQPKKTNTHTAARSGSFSS